MNWGYKILFVYIGFIAFIMGMVYVAMQQTNEMQDEKYYEKELKYQSVIDGKNNLSSLENKISVSNTPTAVKIQLPSGTFGNIENAEVYFLKPSDETKDFKIKLAVDSQGIQEIPNSNLANGVYTIRIAWDNAGQHYFQEENFFVQK
jgi:hypothetical protein